MIKNLTELEDRLSEPPESLVQTLARIPGDIIVLGVAGKMGPSLARMTRRASELAGTSRRVIGVARFSDLKQEAELQKVGIDTIRCDLLDESGLAKLPDAPNVVFMAGMKFGSSGRESLTWAMNTYLPALICKRFAGSRIVAFSTGNVYGLAPLSSGGSVETDSLHPVGEYAMSCVGRERMFEHFSIVNKTPIALIRLNYATDLRYGVLVDLATKVWRGEVIDLAMGYFNMIWQGDANAMALQAFAQVASPPWVLNLSGPETLRVRDVCERLGALMDKAPKFVGKESDTALLSNASKAHKLFGEPRVSADQLIEWAAHWVTSGQPLLNKPTHFESRDGKF